MARLAVDAEAATTFARIAVGHRETQPGALLDRFGREERLRDPSQGCRIYAAPIVLDPETDVIAGFKWPVGPFRPATLPPGPACCRVAWRPATLPPEAESRPGPKTWRRPWRCDRLQPHLCSRASRFLLHDSAAGIRLQERYHGIGIKSQLWSGRGRALLDLTGDAREFAPPVSRAPLMECPLNAPRS